MKEFFIDSLPASKGTAMEYNEKIVLKNGQDCIIRNATYEDGSEMSELFVLTHSESDYLRSYPEEHHFDVNAESEFLQKRAESDREEPVSSYGFNVYPLAQYIRFEHNASKSAGKFGFCSDISHKT
mgnify:CR=1 FL=1